MVTIAFRCELSRWSHQVLQKYIGQQKTMLTFNLFVVPYLPLKGEVLRHYG